LSSRAAKHRLALTRTNPSAEHDRQRHGIL
jgi:hypothetical protein